MECLHGSGGEAPLLFQTASLEVNFPLQTNKRQLFNLSQDNSYHTNWQNKCSFKKNHVETCKIVRTLLILQKINRKDYVDTILGV